MANKNKTKGNANEREFCKIFGEIFEQPFQRVPNSGGMRGGLNNARSKNLSDNQKQLLENDIIPPDCFPKLAIEVKSRNEFNFHHFFRQEGVNELNKWIEQVEESGIDIHERFPSIAFKPNRCGWFMVMWGEHVSDFDFSDTNSVNYIFDNRRFKVVDMIEFATKNRKYLEDKFKN